MDEPLRLPSRGGSVKRARQMAAEEERRRREEYQSDPHSGQHARRQEEADQRQQMSSQNQQMGNGEYARSSPNVEMRQQSPLPVNKGLPRNVQGNRQQQHPAERQQRVQESRHHQQTHPAMREAPMQDTQEFGMQYQLPSNSAARLAPDQFLDENTSPFLSTPLSMVSRDSAASQSSTGTIPEFPAPRGPTALGPPPSARRGPATFYSASSGSVATPIIEERAKASNIKANAPSSYFPGAAADSSVPATKTFFVDESPDEPSIVRSASIGKRARAKATMVQNRSSDKLDQPQGGGVLAKTRNLQKVGMIDNAGGKTTPGQFQRAIEVARNDTPPVPSIVYPQQARRPSKPQWPSFGGDDSPIEGNKELDAMSSSSDDTLTPSPKGDIEMEKLSPAAVLAHARIASPALSHSASTDYFGAEKDPNEIQYNRHSAIRRPPKLNLNAVRDAEARGSLTSLPDLIRRATRLASMMNEGKRPASRLNTLGDFPMETSEKDSIAPSNNARLSGLSGMLAAFPPPGANGTPLATPRSNSHWPQYASSTKALRTPMEGEHKKGRRCCGMPMWCFIISVLLLMCICAAAIVLPLMLIVFKDKPEEEAKKQLSALEICQRDNKCLNGGTIVLNASSCGCVCANGYEGPKCETLGTNGCTTVSFFGTEDGEEFKDVTVGNAIPRLVNQASDRFSVPLAYEALINQFGRLDVACAAANALVTYNGDSGADSAGGEEQDVEDEDTTSKSATAGPTPTSPPSKLEARQGGGGSVDTDIALATGAPKAQPNPSVPTAVAAPTAVSAPTSEAGSGSTGNVTISAETIDFARVAVLYIMQERSLSEAILAQSSLQSLFASVEAPTMKKNSTVSDGIIEWEGTGGKTGQVDLGAWRVSLGNHPENADGVGGRAQGGVRAF